MTMFDSIQCCNCGVVFGVPLGMRDNLRETKKQFFCPNGHPQSYHQNEADRLRRERDLLAQRIAQKDDEIARQKSLRESAERSAAAMRGQVTRLHNRAKAGVCPCCNRHFPDLQRHMASKHKEGDALQ